MRRIELPADPEQREALRHQEAVAHLCVGGRIEAAGCLVVEREHPFAAAVRDLVQHRAVPALDLFRLEQKEVRRELHAPSGIPWCLVDVGDDLVRRQGRIDLEVDAARDLSYGPVAPNAFPPATSARDLTSIRTTSAATGDQVSDTNRIAARIRDSIGASRRSDLRLSKRIRHRGGRG